MVDKRFKLELNNAREAYAVALVNCGLAPDFDTCVSVLQAQEYGAQAALDDYESHASDLVEEGAKLWKRGD